MGDIQRGTKMTSFSRVKNGLRFIISRISREKLDRLDMRTSGTRYVMRSYVQRFFPNLSCHLPLLFVGLSRATELAWGAGSSSTVS